MDKIIFANQLRGLAAMFVVVTHYFGIFFGAQAAVAVTTFSPNLHIPIPDWTMLFVFAWFSTGPFGVAVFFMISGFVIAFSLANSKPMGFLVRRALRIYPTYLACLVFSLMVIFMSARYWGQDFGYSALAIISNALLINHNIGIPSIDLVNWSLSIEIKFYLLMAFFGAGLLRKNFLPLAGFASLVLLGTLLLPKTLALVNLPIFKAMLTSLTLEMNYVLFMLLGAVFYQHMRGIISMPQVLLRSLFVLGVFTANWALGPQRDQFYIVTLNYYYAYTLFLLCYLARDVFRPSKVLDFFADISYPLYLLHSLTGFTLLKMLMDRGLPYFAALALVFPLVLLICYLAHEYVELTSNALGRKLSRRVAH